MSRLAAYPARAARTRRFTLGRPRDLRVAPDGGQVLFLRSTHGEDPVNRLWALDVETATERMLADPEELLDAGAAVEDLPAQERARRERARETGAGIVDYAVDRAHRVVAFSVAGRLFVVDVPGGETSELLTPGPVVDPRPDPTGQRVAYAIDRALRVSELTSREHRGVANDAAATVSWGLAEFIAAEEMGRLRGYWWAADGQRLAAARVDTAPVPRWYVAAPVEPGDEPLELAYPAAGSANADVSLWVVDATGEQQHVEVDWDRRAFPYLARVSWGEQPLTLLVQSRDQRRTRVLVADPDDGSTEVVREDIDPAWVELIDGVPAWTPDGRLVAVVDEERTRRLVVGEEPVTPIGLEVRRVLHVGERGVLVAASTDPTEQHVALVPLDGGEPIWLTEGPGVHSAVAGGAVVAIVSTALEHADTHVEVRALPAAGAPDDPGATGPGPRSAPILISSLAEEPGLEPQVRLLRLGPRQLRAALLLPSEPADRLPVLLDPYGGPHAQRAIAAGGAHLTSRWFAEHGFAVLVIDGRGTPGRGPRWERAVHRDLAGPVLDDQVEGLLAAAAVDERLDLGRVAVRGWSFGGYVAALAVLRRPEVFHAAIAGAPVTDWRLYDTHYTERYLGNPDEDPEPYLRSSLLTEAAAAPDPEHDRPLLLIHGMADDNVVVAHSLRLSRALFEAGRRHTFVPLSGVTHMTPQEVVATRLLELQLRFLREALDA